MATVRRAGGDAHRSAAIGANVGRDGISAPLGSASHEEGAAPSSAHLPALRVPAPGHRNPSARDCCPEVFGQDLPRLDRYAVEKDRALAVETRLSLAE